MSLASPISSLHYSRVSTTVACPHIPFSWLDSWQGIGPEMEFQDNNKSHEAEKPEEVKIKEYDKRKNLGGMKTIPFILGEFVLDCRCLHYLKCWTVCSLTFMFLAVTEVCDRFSTIGFHANMITYLTQQLNLPLVKASNIVSNFNGTASLTPLIGALIADSFAGRFWTIVVGSIIYELVHPSHSLGIFIFYDVAVQISYLKVQMILGF